MYLYDKIVEATYTKIDGWGKKVNYTRKKTLYYFQCNNCKEEFSRPKNGKLRNSDIHFCQKCPHYALAQKETNKIQLKKSEKIGSKVAKHGYKEVYVGPDYPHRKSNWIREHIFVMEKHLGKRIPQGMVVHHIDGNKQNNELDNLLLCSVSEHNNCHARIEKVVFELYQKGIVGFDREKMSYFVK